MDRTILIGAGVLGASSPVLLDSAVKGMALLVVAAVATLVLKRDSAATRHLVWLLAMVALLVVPVLSAMLPRWRVLPEWVRIPTDTAVVSTGPPSMARSGDGAIEVARHADPARVASPSATVYQPATGPPDPPPASVTPAAIPAPAIGSGNWLDALPLVWAMGFCLLILRLMASRRMLGKLEQQGTVIGPSGQPATIHLRFPKALEAACSQLGIGRPVTLLIHPDRTIPLVWGILRHRLMLPAAAQEWSGEQLRSVLLHELAHVKRRDALAQLLAQIACALHWFNPLVWLAGWRMGLECERACDDRVLASGVRPSAYAGHLLGVVTGLSPAGWARSGGLAMARTSSLEGRLVAVLSDRLNRRGLSVALAAIALVLAAGIAVPIAMLRAADHEPGAPAQQESPGAKLPPGTEETLRWGQPVNGLRAAIAIRSSADEPKAGELPDLYLVIQNVSNAPIHLSDTTAAPEPRQLYVKNEGRIVAALVPRDPTGTDAMLQPREVAFLRVFVPDRKGNDGRTSGSWLAEDLLKDAQLTLVAEMKIEKDPAGAWTGKLVTGETNGAAATIKPQPKARTAQAPPTPQAGTTLPPGTEERPRWGEPMNGLRAALVIRPPSEEPKAGEMPELYLALQNVSNAPIRLSDTTAATRLRYLKVRIDGETALGIVINDPTQTDVRLRPREVAFLLMFASDLRWNGHTEGADTADAALRNPRETLVAELKIEQAPAGAWTGKLVTGETTAAVAAGRPQPKDKTAQALFQVWQDNARRSGTIPGGLVGRLGDKVKEFIRLNTGDAGGDVYAKKMAPLVPRCDATRDWTPDEAVALLDDIAAVTDIPLNTSMGDVRNRVIRTGEPLPPSLANAPWGQPLPNGLRMAWVLEPRAAQYRLGTPLKSRILIHNSGHNAVVFRTRTWHQSGGHKARNAEGAEIPIHSVDWTRIAWLVPFRLEPGEFVELDAAGIGVGSSAAEAESHGTRLGAWVEAKAGDEVTFLPDSVPASDWNEAPPPVGEPGWWSGFIAERVGHESPLPTAADERTRLLDRVMRDLFGAAPTREETNAFTADASPAALDSLARRLVQRPGFTPFTGALTSGPTKFRVLPADPNAAKTPRTASGPGHYTLGENARLVVSHRPVGRRIVNEGSIQFFSSDLTRPAPGKPHEIRLPDGYNTWAAAWVRGSNMLWVLQEGTVRRYDFTNPADVKETTLQQPAIRGEVPGSILDALRSAIDVPAAPAAPAAPG
jgi:beta-lactamase regulating signal transducer with metallopeptidase domain